jgi:peptidoglycan/xylan/chitin deacetylase (PgdA/CDA1 family)
MRQPRIAAFAYHDVTDHPSTTGFQRPAAFPYKLPVETFRQHLAVMAAGPCAPARLITDIDLAQDAAYLVLTADDGGRSAMTVGHELEQRGWRGHFFITTSRLGSPGFLDAAGVRALHAAGHVIGSHSHTHPNIFRELSPDRMRDEWRRSIDRLADITGAPCTTASVPGGDASLLVGRTAAAAGIRVLFTSEPTLRPARIGGCLVVGRFCPKVHTTIEYVRRLARLEAWGHALLVRRLKELARRTLPGVYRAYVRRTTQEGNAVQQRDRQP